jgi:hypothetical protein
MEPSAKSVHQDLRLAHVKSKADNNRYYNVFHMDE